MFNNNNNNNNNNNSNDNEDNDDDDDDSNVDAYKYLGVLEGDEIKHTEMKRRIEKEYLRCVRKIL